MKVLQPTGTKRVLIFLVGDLCLTALSFYLAFCLRFDFGIPPRYLTVFHSWLGLVLAFRIGMLAAFRLYGVRWQFISLRDLLNLAKAAALSSAGLVFLNYMAGQAYPGPFLPRSVILMDFVLFVVLVGGFRISRRVYMTSSRRGRRGKRTLIVGAGRVGEQLVRDLLRSDRHGYYPVAFLDDNPSLKGTQIHGVSVLGGCDDIADVARDRQIEAAIIAIRAGHYARIREIFLMLAAQNIADVKVVPSLPQFGRDAISVRQMQDIRIEDLLPRDSVSIERPAVTAFLQGKQILVSGAGGSIGSEMVRQILKFDPKHVVAYDIDETELYNLALELHGLPLTPYIGDIRDRDKLERAFAEYKPEIVFHAAAYKHVPKMEDFPAEAIETNVFGTRNMAELSAAFGVNRFVNTSTDKAVNPSSIMGASKRMAEILCSTLNQTTQTRFVSVRFGNVLGSRGGVIGVFLDQIRKGGPVRVTHPEMKRYFMSIPEAVLLVCQAAAMGAGGEVFVLDMGEPVHIVKVAEDLIRLHGLNPYQDIKIVFTGTRPGEKLFEELMTAEEGTNATSHQKIFTARQSTEYSAERLESALNELWKQRATPDRIREALQKHVPFYDTTKGKNSDVNSHS